MNRFRVLALIGLFLAASPAPAAAESFAGLWAGSGTIELPGETSSTPCEYMEFSIFHTADSFVIYRAVFSCGLSTYAPYDNEPLALAVSGDDLILAGERVGKVTANKAEFALPVLDGKWKVKFHFVNGVLKYDEAKTGADSGFKADAILWRSF